MISKTLSVKISNVLVKLVFLGLVAAIFLTPTILKHYIDFFDKTQNDFYLLVILIYMIMLPAFTAILCLNRLLKNIGKAQIFERENVRLLRVLSWCCFVIAIICGGFGFAYVLFLLIAFAALFFGLILRVLKNVFAEAVSIKEENDFTV